MSSDNNLKRAIQMYDFYLLELNLYLDTHPNDANALKMFNEYQALRSAAAKKYVEKYGPIIADEASTNNVFDWIDDPWPWERSAN